MSFETLPAPLPDALTARGYAEPTAVQSAVPTPEAAGRDLLVSAQTGSGKTVAYGLALAPELGLRPVERAVDVAEWTDGVASGAITEVFACGTAATVVPIGTLVDGEHRHPTPGPTTGPDSVAMRLRTALLDVQHGRAEDRHGWMHRLA